MTKFWLLKILMKSNRRLTMIYFTRPNRHSTEEPTKCNSWTLWGAKRTALKRGDAVVGKNEKGRRINLLEYFAYRDSWVVLF